MNAIFFSKSIIKIIRFILKHNEDMTMSQWPKMLPLREV